MLAKNTTGLYECIIRNAFDRIFIYRQYHVEGIDLDKVNFVTDASSYINHNKQQFAKEPEVIEVYS